MKRTSIVLACVALACGAAATAQTREESRAAREADATRSAPDTTRHSENKLGQAMHRLGDKTRSAIHRMGKGMHARRDGRDDTRAMGAAPDRDRDRDLERERRDRMDSAYDNWKSRQHERSESR